MKKQHWFLKILLVLILCGLAGTALAAFLFLKNPDPSSASAKIEFTFNGSTDATAPNGLIYSINELSSDEVLNTALTSAGMSDRYTVDEVRSGLRIAGQYPSDLLDKVNNFISLINFDANQSNLFSTFNPTLFNVTLYNRFDSDISESDQTKLLESIMSTYKGYFRENYGASLNLDTFNSSFDSTSYDYIQQLEILEQQIRLISDFSLEMYRRAPTFMLNGVNFNDIAVRLQNLSTSSIPQLSANMFLNSLAKNPQRLLNQYQFSLRNLVYELETKQKNLNNLDTLIASFERNGIVYLSANNSFTKIDGNSSLTYNTLNELKNKLISDISEVTANITLYQTRMNDMSKLSNIAKTESEHTNSEINDTGTAASADPITLDNLTETIEAAEGVSGRQIGILQRQIDSISSEKDRIVADFQALLTAYSDQQINDGTVTVSDIKYTTPSLVSIDFIKKAIKTAFPFCVAGFILCILSMLPELKKRYSWETLSKDEAA
ncbi:MAG: hypothetical protein IJ242_10760 [Clostridia bacterium]|nr:hypothetical protein [Clostridia bacterium]